MADSRQRSRPLLPLLVLLAGMMMMMMMVVMMMMNAEGAEAAGGGKRKAARGLPGWAVTAYRRAAGQSNRPKTVAAAADEPSLEYYVQVDTSGDDIGIIVEPTDADSTASFGEIEAFAFNVTSGYDAASSQLLGVIRGFTVQTSSSSTSHSVEVEVLVYDDGAGTNGTLSLQGHITSSADEIAIVGGSGSFRGVSGYDVITYVNASSSTLFVYHHALYFLSSSSSSSSPSISLF
jgi:hypothetical protein